MSALAARRRGRTGMESGTVRLNISRLRLHGVAPAEAGRMTRALEAELARLAAQPGSQYVRASTERIPAARIVAGRLPEQTGRAAALALWSTLVAPARVTGPKERP